MGLSLDNSYFFSMNLDNSLLGYGLYVPSPSSDIIQTHAWDILNDTVFNLPLALEYARKNNMPFVLIIPSDYKNKSTISHDAPISEGSRVALAWVSAYFRFSLKSLPMDVRVLLIDSPIKELHLYSDDIESVLSVNKAQPEVSMKQRIRSLNTQGQGAELSLSPWLVPVDQELKVNVISPQFEGHAPRIVITGGAGFIGSHMAKRFLDKGYQVVVLDNLSCCSGENIKDLKNNPNFEFYNVDVCKPFDIEGRVDVVAHLASLPSPEFYYRLPIETLQTGLHATKETLELARRKKARYLFTSTSEVYGDPEVHPQHELYEGNVDPIGKRSQYDQSKRGAETLIKLYYEKYNIDVRVARIFNTYGPGMELHDGRVITNFISALLEDKEMVVYGDGNQTRSLVYISDMINGLEKLVEADVISSFTSMQQRIFNIGNPGEFTINQVADMANDLARKYLNRDVIITHIPQFDQTDPKVRKPDIAYIQTTLGFNPEVIFMDGLEKTFLHYQDVCNKK